MNWFVHSHQRVKKYRALIGELIFFYKYKKKKIWIEYQVLIHSW